MRKAAEQATRASRIIARLRRFLRRAEPAMEFQPLVEIVEETASIAEIEARRAGVTLVVDAPPDLPEVSIDRIMIEQVVLNLVKNGIEAMQQTPPGERALSLTARLDGEGMVEVAVADRGCGLTDEQIERLFTPFFTTKAEGMGMGLNICRSIVEYHDGRLWVQPNPGGGSVFRFTLPLGVES
jgi:signal transduction histidine kinase